MPNSFNKNSDAANPVLSAPPEHFKRIGRSAVLKILSSLTNVVFFGSRLECNERSMWLMFNSAHIVRSGPYQLARGFSPLRFTSDLMLFRLRR